MAIMCPKCLSTNTHVYASRSKHYNGIAKEFDTSEIPVNIMAIDHVLRRHKCKNCGNTFPTIETYYRKMDVDEYCMHT